MTAVGFEDRCPHALRDEALQLGLDGLVLGGYDVPAWLGSPGGSFNLLIEEIRCRRSMRCPDEFLLMLRQITGKGRNTVWFQPNTSVCHFNMREDVCGRKLFLQTLCRFVSIWRKRSDVNESGGMERGSQAPDARSSTRRDQGRRGGKPSLGGEARFRDFKSAKGADPRSEYEGEGLRILPHEGETAIGRVPSRGWPPKTYNCSSKLRQNRGSIHPMAVDQLPTVTATGSLRRVSPGLGLTVCSCGRWGLLVLPRPGMR